MQFITRLHKFRVYMMRGEYTADTGQQAPTWNSDRAPECWFNPGA